MLTIFYTEKESDFKMTTQAEIDEAMHIIDLHMGYKCCEADKKYLETLIRAAQATKTNCKLETIMLLTDEPFPPTPNVVARPVYAHVWPKPDKEYEYIVREKK